MVTTDQSFSTLKKIARTQFFGSLALSLALSNKFFGQFSPISASFQAKFFVSKLAEKKILSLGYCDENIFY